MIDRKEAVLWLNKFGYLDDDYRPSSNTLSKAVKRMQKWYRLKQDGHPGPVTRSAMGLFRCGVPDIRSYRIAGSTDCRWHKERLQYYHSSNFKFPNISRTQSQKLVATAWKLWTQHIPVKVEKGRYSSRADIRFDMGRGARYGFDGVGNVLAWAEMPCLDTDVQLQTMYDADEPWTREQQAAGVYALAVLAHEIGHVLGLDHSQNAGDLMAPFYNPAIWAPQAGDVKRVQRYYGESTEDKIEFNVAGKMVVTNQGTKMDLKFV